MAQLLYFVGPIVAFMQLPFTRLEEDYVISGLFRPIGLIG